MYDGAMLFDTSSSRDRIVHPIATLRRLEEVLRDVGRDLVLLRPLTDAVEVSARVLGVEVDVCFWSVRHGWLEPDLTHDADVDGAHELLPDDVEAVRYPDSQQC